MFNTKKDQMETRKSKFKIFLILIIICLLISYISMFYFIWTDINSLLGQFEGILAIIIIFFRISILAIFTTFLLRKWFKQEAVYSSDAYFLFAIFFLILISGKVIDLSISLLVFSEISNYLLLLFKLRYFIVAINAIPLLYLGLEVIMNLFDLYIKKISKKRFNLLKISLISIFSITITGFILLAPTLELILNILPIVTTFAMIGIVILFILMYRMKRLSQANGLIIGIGFILVIISSLFRPSLTKGFDISMLILAELIDQVIYILIFIGFIKNPPYAKKTFIEMRKNEIKEVY
ncbi:MAG: hypothetical protein KGD63_06595 [Candidatus Lokiarchaeota archaeon]|nr:hypothetical protein [Candidatus Lokiarchaeota archaeon]